MAKEKEAAAVSAQHLRGSCMPPTAHVGGGNAPPPQQQQATGIMALPPGLGINTCMPHVAPFAGGTVVPTGNALGSAMLGLLPQPQAGCVGPEKPPRFMAMA